MKRQVYKLKNKGAGNYTGLTGSDLHLFINETQDNVVASIPYAGTARTISRGEFGYNYICSSVTAIAITVPTNASAPLPIGFKTKYTQSAAGVITIGGSGITFITSNGQSTVLGQTVELEKVDTDTWKLDFGASSSGGGGGITRTIVNTSGSATMGAAANTDYVYLVTGAHTTTLPTAVGNTNRYTVKNKHTANITVDTTSSQTIDGTLTISLNSGASVDIISDNTNWNII